MAATDNFFTTQVSLDKNRPYTSQKMRKFQPNSQINAYQKMRQIKQQLKNVSEQYLEALTNSQKTKHSLEKANRITQITRINFLKVYQTKKLKMLEKNLLEEKKERQKIYSNQCHQKARKIKLQAQLQSILQKNEEQQTLQRLRDKNRKEKEFFKQQLRITRNNFHESARRQFQMTKNAQTQLMVRRRKIESMLQARAKQNYLTKVNRQLQMLNNYNILANNIGDMEESEEIPSLSKSFFITRN